MSRTRFVIVGTIGIAFMVVGMYFLERALSDQSVRVGGALLLFSGACWGYLFAKWQWFKDI